VRISATPRPSTTSSPSKGAAPAEIHDGAHHWNVSSSGSVGGAIFLLVVIIAIVAFVQIYRRRK
jgi:hypothetical protein